MWKFLDPTGCTYRDGKAFQYNLPQRGQEWSEWTQHPDPVQPDGYPCGPGRLHLMHRLSAHFAPSNWWPWWAEGQGLIGEDRDKAGFVAVRLRRVSPMVFARCLRPPFNWGYDTDLQEINLPYSDLRGAKLDLTNLTHATLHWVSLRGASLRGAMLSSAILSNADLRGADLTGANLHHADLRWARLHGACLRDADLGTADLHGADLDEACLEWASLCETTLCKTQLQGADLQHADLHGANLCGANLRGAHLGKTRLGRARWNQSTLWPEGFTPPGTATSSP